MQTSIRDLSRSLTVAETEIAVRNRSRNEEIDEVLRALASLDENDVQVLAQHFPEILQARQFTKEQLMKNTSGECALLNRLYQNVLELTEQRLKHLEDSLC